VESIAHQRTDHRPSGDGDPRRAGATGTDLPARSFLSAISTAATPQHRQGSAPLANGQRTEAHGASPWRFTGGTINRVTADISGESYPTSSWNSPR
jgi:hypothetical protein